MVQSTRLGLFLLTCLCVTAISCRNSTALLGSREARSDSQDKKLHDLLSAEWEYELKTTPEMATEVGDSRYNSLLSDYSPETQGRQAQEFRGFLRQFEQISPAALSDEGQLNRTLILRRLRDKIEASDIKDWEMPVDQMNGVHLMFAELPGLVQFTSAHDYDDYVSRLQKLPAAFQQIEQSMRLGVQDHLMPPRYLLEKVATQAAQIAATQPGKSAFGAPVSHFPASLSDADQKRYRTAVLDTIRTAVNPAYRTFAEFVRTDYAPQGRTEPGVWSLPDGDARYRRAVRVMTTTSLTPEDFHQVGLRQVNEIEEQMITLARKLGYSDLKSFNAHIKNSKQFYATSGDQMLTLFRGYIDHMRPEMPKLFGHLPKAPLEVIPMEEFRAKEAAAADYQPGSRDGKRPGRVNINEWDPTHRLTINIESVAYHEGIPGHHQQIALGQELPGLPEFRKNADYNAFVEGWALYAERLGKEVGFYKDPYSEYGRLEDEMWRAVRLVVDTGVHYKHWTRDQMVAFFRAHTAVDEPNIQAEVDRYIAWPGQALAYKAGQLKILELRDRAQHQLGSRFDLRAFHDAVLGESALPLDVLETRINAWIAKRK